MKVIILKPRLFPAPLLAGILLIPVCSQAAQLAYEGFNYAGGVDNLSGMSGGTGWLGAWQTVNNGSASVLAGSLAAGSGAPAGYDLLSSGNSSNLPNNRRVGRQLDTSTNGPFGSRGYRDGNGNIGKDGTTIYISFMQQPDGTSAYYEFEFHRGNLGDPGRIAGIGNDQSGDNVNLRAPNGTHTPIGAGSTSVNYYVVRIDFKPGNDDVYVYRNPTSATEPGVPTLTRLAAADMSFNGISFGAFNSGRVVSHDEVRLGQTWSDVNIPVSAQPAFVSQPRPSVTAQVGGSISLTAVANGQPAPAYQWFHGTDALSGQTGSTLALGNLNPLDGGTYHVTATNSGGIATSGDSIVTVNPTPSGLLVYEGFDYNVGTTNMDGKAGGLGWAAPWKNVNGGGGNVAAGSLAAGNNAPNGYDAKSLANSSFIPNQQRDGRLVDTSPGSRLANAGYVDANGNVGADGKSLYLSFLQQPDGTSLFYEFEFHRGDLGDPGRIGGVGNDTNNPTVGLRTGGTTTVIGPGSTAVNFYVVRIDFKPGNDDVYVYQNPVSATEPGTPTLMMLDASDMSFNGVSLAAFVNSRTVKHDEIRLGQAWSDVVFGTSRRELTWQGNGTTNRWDLTSLNWNDGTAVTQFSNGDPVTFDDSGSNSPAVNVLTDISTASVKVENWDQSYTIGGVGKILSSGGLTKSGIEALTLNGPASFGSALVVNEGDIKLNGTATFGGEFNLNIGAGTATLSGINSFVGSLVAVAGIQKFSGTNQFAGMELSNTTTTVTGPTTITGTGGTAIWIGNLAGSDSSLTIEAGGSLNMTGIFKDAWVIGRDGGSGSVIQNGGTVSYDSSNHPDAFIAASGQGGTTGSYEMHGGTLEMSNARLGLAIGPVTGTLTQTGGVIRVRQLDLGSNLNTGTGIYDLTGGQLTVGVDGITSSANSEINLGGGTIAAAANWNSSLAMTLTDEVGDVTFDTAGHSVVLSGPLSGTGGLIKVGAGTLAITAFNDYTGPTMVNAGTLGGGGADNSDVTVAAGAGIAPGNEGIGTFFCASVAFTNGSTYQVDIDCSLGEVDDLISQVGSINITGATVGFNEIGTGFIAENTEFAILESATTIVGTFTGRPNGSQVVVGGNTYTIHYLPKKVTLTSAGSPYGNWAASQGLDGSPGKESAFDADPDGDGIANGLEWILGGDPLDSDASSLVTASASGANGITLTFSRAEASVGVAELVVEYSAGLAAPWKNVPVEQAGGSYADGVTVAVNQASSPDSVTVNVPASNAASGKLFARLRAVIP